MKKHLICISLFAGILPLTGYEIDHSNSIPVVTIISPSGQTGFQWNDKISYQIQVEDKEDGSSRFEEIEENEVFMMSKFFHDDNEKDKTLFEKKEREGSAGLASLKKNNCFNCHSLHNKVTAPSFENIANRYKNQSNIVDQLSIKIIKGSKGVWSNEQIMPSHPHVSKEEAAEMISWILDNGTDKELDIQRGIKGIISTPSTTSTTRRGIGILIASYIDRGLNGNDRKIGKHKIILQHH